MARKAYHDDFRFKNRNGVFYVIYRTRPDRPISTGQQTENDAVAWAYSHIEDKPKTKLTFRQFAQDFFIPGKCPWTIRMTKKGRSFGAEYLPGHRSRLECYLLPEFGPLLINAISTKMIDRWLIDLQSIRKDQPLAAATKDKILIGLRLILREAVYEGLISDNPAEYVEPFKDNNPGREVFSVEELTLFFPEDIDRLLEIWGSLQWAAFFYIMASCGLRPGEAAGFQWGDWIRTFHGAVIQRSVENKTGRMKGLKTDKNGIQMKPAIFTEKAEQLLLMLEAKLERTGFDDLIFQINNKPLKTETILKHFKYSCQRAGVNRRERTTYCLRHSFNTHLLRQASLQQVQELMGHTTLTSSRRYNHPRAEDLLAKAQGMRTYVNVIYDPRAG